MRFAGSHDLAVAWLASHFSELAPGYGLSVAFQGSLGGLMSLASGDADIAGCHLWDQETGTYNDSFVRRVLPGEAGHAGHAGEKTDGTRRGARQPSRPERARIDLGKTGGPLREPSGRVRHRVWLDVELRRSRTDSGRSEWVRTRGHHAFRGGPVVAEGEVDAGLALQGSALAYGLDFVPLTIETYDLAIPDPEHVWALRS